MASEEEGLLSSARQCPLNVGRSLEPEGVTCLQLLANGRRNRGEVKTGGLSWAHEERRWIARVVETPPGAGVVVDVLTILPSDAMSLCLV